MKKWARPPLRESKKRKVIDNKDLVKSTFGGLPREAQTDRLKKKTLQSV